MSVCRFWWDGSQVYVYGSDRGWECCACLLTRDDGWDPTIDYGETEDAEMVAHLTEHVEAGHIVPPHAFDAFGGEHPDPDPAIAARDKWRKENHDKYGFMWDDNHPINTPGTTP